MGNEIYEILKDGTVIDDKYVENTVKEVDEALKNGSAKIVYSRNRPGLIRVNFKEIPKYIQRELKPFINTK
jgi:hypothetical protein